MHARFWAPSAETTGDVVALHPDEVEHLSRVLRLRVGATVRVFNGAGAEFHAVIENVSKREALVRLGQAATPAPELPARVTLAQAVLKGDGMDGVVRDAAMLGVHTICPLVTARTEVNATALARGHRVARWERIALSAVKQCGRALIPAVWEPRSLDEVLQTPSGVLMLVEPKGSAAAISLRELDPTPPTAATLIVGPEGGWSPEEVEAGAAAVQLITLGALTLRADAAPSIAIGALLAHWKLL